MADRWDYQGTNRNVDVSTTLNALDLEKWGTNTLLFLTRFFIVIRISKLDTIQLLEP